MTPTCLLSYLLMQRYLSKLVFLFHLKTPLWMPKVTLCFPFFFSFTVYNQLYGISDSTRHIEYVLTKMLSFARERRFPCIWSSHSSSFPSLCLLILDVVWTSITWPRKHTRTNTPRAMMINKLSSTLSQALGLGTFNVSSSDGGVRGSELWSRHLCRLTCHSTLRSSKSSIMHSSRIRAFGSA